MAVGCCGVSRSTRSGLGVSMTLAFQELGGNFETIDLCTGLVDDSQFWEGVWIHS